MVLGRTDESKKATEANDVLFALSCPARIPPPLFLHVAPVRMTNCRNATRGGGDGGGVGSGIQIGALFLPALPSARARIPSVGNRNRGNRISNRISSKIYIFECDGAAVAGSQIEHGSPLLSLAFPTQKKCTHSE